MSSNHSETNNIEIIGFQNYEKENALINKYLDGLDGNSHMSRFDYIVQKWGYQDPDTTLEGLFKHFRANGGSSKNFMELHFNTRTDEKHLFGTLETWHLERLQEKYFLKSNPSISLSPCTLSISGLNRLTFTASFILAQDSSASSEK